MNIKEFIRTISNVLNIKEPKIKYNNKDFTTNTQLACADLIDNVIYLKDKAPLSLDTYFVIAHECRHLYQYNNESWHDIVLNHTNNNKLSLNDYNNQLEEIDAHAFAGLIMINLFNVKPLFNSFNDKTKKRILSRMEEIKKELDYND